MESHPKGEGDRMAIRFIAPIQNFRCAMNRLELGNNTLLLKYSDAELRKIQVFLEKAAPQQDLVNEVLDQVRHRFVVQTTRREENNIPHLIEPLWLLFESILNALRIFKKGDIWLNNLYGLEHAGKGEVLPQTRYHTAHDLDKFTPYQLDLNETVAFTNFWTKFRQATKKPFIDRAVRRFGQAIERWKFDDKLLDYMVSFECLFSTGRAESRHKISRRTAVLLENGDKAKEISQHMKKFYDYRSDIAHGRTIDYGAINEQQLGAIQNYLRTCLKKIIEEERFNRQDLHDYLDFHDKESS